MFALSLYLSECRFVGKASEIDVIWVQSLFGSEDDLCSGRLHGIGSAQMNGVGYLLKVALQGSGIVYTKELLL